jgi:hypothetical protein
MASGGQRPVEIDPHQVIFKKLLEALDEVVDLLSNGLRAIGPAVLGHNQVSQARLI